MTEAQAWREIAARIEKRKWEKCGLCAEVWRLYADGLDPETRDRMFDRVRAHGEGAPRYDSYYFWPEGQTAPRILAAYFLALEAEDEAR